MTSQSLQLKIVRLEAALKKCPEGYVKDALKADLRLAKAEHALLMGQTSEEAYLQKRAS